MTFRVKDAPFDKSTPRKQKWPNQPKPKKIN
jgi:hypothetical protein